MEKEKNQSTILQSLSFKARFRENKSVFDFNPCWSQKFELTYFLLDLTKLMKLLLKSNLSFITLHSGLFKACYIPILKVYPIIGTSILTKLVLFTKWPNFTMLFYHVKMPAHSSHQSSNSPLTGDLKQGTVYTFISIGTEIRKGQS